MISKKHLGVGAGIGVLAIIFGLTYMPQPQNGAVTVPNPVSEDIPDNTAPTNDAITEDSVPAVVTTIAPSESQDVNTSDNAPVVNSFPIELPTPTDNTPGVTYSSHPHHSSGGGGSNNNEDNNSSGDNNNEDIPPILVIPESPIGLIALFGSSLATLGAYLFYQRSH